MSAVPIRVLHVAAEVFPLVKTGGLADVIAALPPALAGQGVDARLLLPGFPAVINALLERRSVAEVGPAFGAARVTVRRGRIPASGLVAYVVDAPWLYARDGSPYQNARGEDWPDNPRRFALLGWVAAHLATGEFGSGWRPDILHAHDWHAALAPAYLAAHPAHALRSVFTVHNLAYQGLFPIEQGAALGLEPEQLSARGLEFHGRGSFMKGGLIWSDRITTVSPRYAEEICTPAFGCGLEGVIASRRDRLSGILNGVDYALWNPAADPHIGARYSAADTAGKRLCKSAVQRECGLDERSDAPLFTVVSRLTGQKGMDLLVAALPALLQAGGQLALLGTGDRAVEDAFRAAAAAHPGRVAARFDYDEALAHRLIAGADVILVPSRFEPCGLTQLYGLRYGAVPLVRQVGGLADTVIDADTDAARGTGFAFRAAAPADLENAVHRAVAAWRDPGRWQAVVARGMAEDHSWSDAAAHYAALYRSLLAR